MSTSPTLVVLLGANAAADWVATAPGDGALAQQLRVQFVACLTAGRNSPERAAYNVLRAEERRRQGGQP